MNLKFILPILAVCLCASAAQASNLNTESNLVDEGIEAEKAPASILDGIPLMPGLLPETSGDVIQILPASDETGSVVTHGIVDVDDVYNFYKRALPPLGWLAADGRDYVHGPQSLHIDAHADGKMSTVTFSEETIGQ